MIRLPSLFAKRLAALVAAKSDVHLNVATEQGTAEVSTRALTAIVTGVRGLHLNYSLLVTGDRLQIGRDPDCDLCFPGDAYVSGRHALLFLEDGEWLCTDVGSTNRTFLGGQPIGPMPVMIPPGGVLRFGMQALQIDYALGAAPLRSAAVPKPKPAVDPETACWVPPNVPVTIGPFKLPGGLLYIGEQLPKVKGGGVEPALIIPSLKIGRAAPHPETRSGYGYYWSSWYWSAYDTLSAGRRRMYLEWLAGGRQGPADEGCLFLFLYGLERRALGRPSQAPPGELAAIRSEVERLAARYPTLHAFRQKASQFLSALGLLALMSDDAAALPDADALLRLPRGGHGYYGRLPVLLDVALARFAAQKRSLPADYAWAWYLFDPDISPRTPATRCPNEMRLLFTRRYEEAFGDGVRLRTIKTLVSVDYQPANPSLGGGLLRVGGAAASLLHRVSSTPLNKQIAPLAENCADALDPYSRALARNPDARGTFPLLALLPADVLQNHANASGLKRVLEAAAAASSPNTFAVFPARDLLAHGGASWQPANGEPLAKSDAALLAQAAEKLGFLLEPDVRSGAPANALRPDTRVVVARLPVPADTPIGPDLALAALAGLLAFVAHEVVPPESAAQPQATRREEIWRLLDGCLGRLPAGTLSLASDDRLRFRARLRWLTENPEAIKPPRRNTLPPLAPAGRDQFANLLVFVALASGNGVTNLATIKTLVRAFTLLDLDESLVYTKVHGRATRAASPETAFAAPNDLVTVVPASPGAAGFVLPTAAPPPPGGTVRRAGRGKNKDVVALDKDVIARSLHESAQVSELLAGIFTDEADEPPFAAPATVPPEVTDAPGAAGLDARHTDLLARLRDRDVWTAAEFAALARKAGLPLPAGALETLNEAALETTGETVLDGDDLLTVNRDVILEM